jgi:urease accessory protein UreF
VHSGGLEEAAARGVVRTESDLPEFLRTRLHTAGLLSAVFAAAAAVAEPDWRRLDEELDARTPSEAQRTASRTQGRAMARAARVMGAGLRPPVQRYGTGPTEDVGRGVGCGQLAGLLDAFARPHHPLVLGAIVGVPRAAALAAAYLAVSGPASASVRLLGLDPLRVNATVAALAGDIEAVADRAAATAGLDPADLPAPGSPGLDLLAEEHDRHHREEVRLFVS